MITEITIYACTCNNCGEQWQDDGMIAFVSKNQMETAVMEDNSWVITEDEHYCPDCWVLISIQDNG